MLTYIHIIVTYSKNSSMVFFWDLTSGEVHSKNVGNLKFLAAHGDICAVVVSEKDDRGGRKQVRVCIWHGMAYMSVNLSLFLSYAVTVQSHHNKICIILNTSRALKKVKIMIRLKVHSHPLLIGM